ncbi:putative interleukin-17 receptor E-like [Haplochromis burtoni]|uniref:Interleukin 17 receptor E like n=1 Tax=Haplochromis burtoni TaxID=8153 RepID=A0A3Q2WBZ6_HAPBU|nr:putative interleukin-17 receptor E-like [Haplochromis burtoni]
MILWVGLLLVHCCLCLTGAGGESPGLETCMRCSQGLHCKTKGGYSFPRPCENPAESLNTSTVFHNVSLSTVMKCERMQKCSLRLGIKAVVQIADSIHGVSFCITTAGRMTGCRTFSFTRASRERMSGLQVEIENNCTEVSPNQQVQVTVTTVPSYCGMTWTSTYHTPGCSHEDFRRHVPECITGRLSYKVNPDKKELSVNVSDMLNDHNYHLRLCRKDFICSGTGAYMLIKKEQPIKSATFPYSRPLPCLCIEGWSAVMDAPRVQVCPFKDRVEELWFGITFDPLEETLLWEPACPITATAALCQMRDDGICVDLPHSSQNVTREKIAFSKVDPHDRVCVKFTAGSQSWTRCPFADGRLQAWELVTTRTEGHEEVKMLSQISANFSVELCVKSEGSPECQTIETHNVQVEKQKAVDLNLKGASCNSCLQIKRLDVEYAATVIHCLKLCSDSSPLRSDLTWVFVLTGVCLFGVICVTLVLHVLLTVHRRRKQKITGVRNGEKQIDPPPTCLVSVLQTQPVVHGGVFIPDSPQCGNNEKANLLSE